MMMVNKKWASRPAHSGISLPKESAVCLMTELYSMYLVAMIAVLFFLCNVIFFHLLKNLLKAIERLENDRSH